MLRDRLKQFDTNGDGGISPEEFRRGLQRGNQQLREPPREQRRARPRAGPRRSGRAATPRWHSSRRTTSNRTRGRACARSRRKARRVEHGRGIVRSNGTEACTSVDVNAGVCVATGKLALGAICLECHGSSCGRIGAGTLLLSIVAQESEDEHMQCI